MHSWSSRDVQAYRDPCTTLVSLGMFFAASIVGLGGVPMASAGPVDIVVEYDGGVDTSLDGIPR